MRHQRWRFASATFLLLLVSTVLSACGNGEPSPAVRSALAQLSESPAPLTCWPIPRIDGPFTLSLGAQRTRRDQYGVGRATLLLRYDGATAAQARRAVRRSLRSAGYRLVLKTDRWTYLQVPGQRARVGYRVLPALASTSLGQIALDVTTPPRPTADPCAPLPPSRGTTR